MKAEEPAADVQTQDVSIRDKIVDLGFRVETDKKGHFLAHELLGDRIIPEHRRPVATLEALLDLVETEVGDHGPVVTIEEGQTSLSDENKADLTNLVKSAFQQQTTPKENLMVDPKLRSENAGEKPFLHSVKTPLTDKEMLIYTDELTALDTKEKEILHTFEAQKTAYKSEQSKVDDSKNHLMHLLKTKEEWKDVECFNDFSFEEGICTIIRKSTGEIVSTRKMNADEFRRALPFKAVEQEEQAAAG